jgi:hypothetical protein
MAKPRIESYQFGRIVIDAQAYSRDVIILPVGVVSNWRRIQGHSLSVDDLAAVLEISPEVLVIGQGAVSRMSVPIETSQVLEAAGMELFTAPTEEACQIYNTLREQKRVAAALHLTC